MDATTIPELVERRARESPDGVFCFFGDEALTFGGLGEAVDRLASGLAGVGIAAGDRVAVMLPNHPDHASTLLALAKLGATHVPVNVHLKTLGLRYLLEHSEARGVIADARYAAELGPALAGPPRVETVVWRGGAPAAGPGRTVRFEAVAAAGGPEAPRHEAGPDHVVAIMYTSGTTGPPKGVMLTDRMCRTAGRTAGLVADVRPGDVVFQWEPYYHIVGLQNIVLGLHYGVATALVERFSASGLWAETRRHRATQIHYLGGVLALLMKQPPREDDARNPVRIAYGAAAPPAMWPLFERRFGVRIRECYGLTEGASFTTANFEGKVGSVGKPVDHFEVRIVGDDGRPLGSHQVGEIVQRGREPGLLMPGYFKNPEGTRAALRDGWLHTGDLGYCDEDGFFYFCGRKMDSLRRRGENVSAWEVERVVAMYPGVEECAVIGVPAEVGEDDIKVFVKMAGGQLVEPLDLVRWCERHLAYFQVPRYVELVDEFPRTPTQRIRKEELPRSVARSWDLEQSGYRLRRDR